MKKMLTQQKLTFVLISVIISVGFNLQLKAQADVATLMKAGIADANELIDAYISPMGKSFGTAMNSGWFNTARYLKPGGFDLNISFSGVMAPKSAKTYNFSDLNMTSLQLVDPNADPESPTIFGEDKEGPEFGIKINNPLANLPNHSPDTFLTTFNAPPGIGGYFGLPSAQLRIGTYKHTDLIIRYMPTIELSGDITGEIGMWGVGIKHDIKQWIPGLKDKPFDLALLFAYSNFSFEINFARKLLPDTSAIYDTISFIKPYDNLGTYDDQGFTYDVSAINVAAIISKKLSILTLYGALGFNSSTAKMNLNGHYPVPIGMYGNTSTGTVNVINEDFENPINITTKMFTPKITVGFRLKLAIITINADYTYSKYPYFSAGFGFVIRESKEE